MVIIDLEVQKREPKIGPKLLSKLSSNLACWPQSRTLLKFCAIGIYEVFFNTGIKRIFFHCIQDILENLLV